MLNEREQSIFMRGIAVGMRAVQEWETDLEQETITPNNKVKVTGKNIKKIIKKAKKALGKKRIVWTPAEDKILKQNPNHPMDTLIIALGNRRSATAIAQRRQKLGIKQTLTKKRYPKGIARLNQKMED